MKASLEILLWITALLIALVAVQRRPRIIPTVIGARTTRRGREQQKEIKKTKNRLVGTCQEPGCVRSACEILIDNGAFVRHK